MAPQLTLFGSASSPRPIPPAATAPPAVAYSDLDRAGAAHEPPAFERRALLRDERHRLVSELTRQRGTNHREINAWLNQKLGVTSVEQATIEDLERSVELLIGKLTRRR